MNEWERDRRKAEYYKQRGSSAQEVISIGAFRDGGYLSDIPELHRNRIKKIEYRYPSYVHGPYRSSEYVDKTEFAVWERWEPTNNQPRSYTMIFGHTPTCYYQADDPIRIYKNKKVIGIDCGSGYSRMRLAGARLACLRLDDMKEFYSDCD